jgi:LAO/AO transport system kinase
MNSTPIRDRRALSRALSRAGNATVSEILRMTSHEGKNCCRRIGLTGPPGAGKSSLIAQLARRRLRRSAELAVVAIDPTSPISGGALLGDRIRMQDIGADPHIYIRSLASRNSSDGLTDNLPGIFEIFDRAGFAELIVETVGTGQVDCMVRNLVDTTVLVLMPGTGDQVQAMKSGILELADIYVLNKADQPGAERAAADLKQTLRRRSSALDSWEPPIVLTSTSDQGGFDRLNDEIDRHQEYLSMNGSCGGLKDRRRASYVSSLVARRVSEVLHELPCDVLTQPTPELYRSVVAQLLPVCSAPHEEQAT